jgi:hypothetical protein
MGQTARDVVDYMRKFADVSAGIAIDNVQFEESQRIRTAVFRELDARNIFDRVYSDLNSFPRSLKNVTKAFNACYELCRPDGMILMTGLSDWAHMQKLLLGHNVTTFWMLREKEVRFDVLFKKPSSTDG